MAPGLRNFIYLTKHKPIWGKSNFASLIPNKSDFLQFFLNRYKVESRIADAICKNKTLLKVGLKFQFTEVYDRVSNHLIANIDKRRADRVREEGPSQVKWKPPKTID